MLFNSYGFVFLFFPLVLAGLAFCRKAEKGFRRGESLEKIYLFAVSLIFYGWRRPEYLPVLIGSMAVNYGLCRQMEDWDALLSKTAAASGTGREKAGRRKKGIVTWGIVFNLGLLGIFKYADTGGFVPTGISFFTFQQISYLVDSYRGETKGYSFDEYALFVSFFPQLIAGPIVLHNETIPQFREPEKRRINYENFSRGIYIFAVGLFKKVIIADTFGIPMDYAFGVAYNLNTLETFLMSLCYTFQLYFDFSGYCDMAIGISGMFNIALPHNFNSPYKALSITDFWDRWHMSLTRFLKTYIYIPLGGNRKGKIRTYINVMIVFLVSGIWHGANWTFVLWGALHGILSCLNRMFYKQWNKLWKPIRWGATFLCVDLLWVIFRADNIATAMAFFKQLFSLKGFQIREELLMGFRLEEFAFLEERIPFLGYLPDHVTGFYLWLFLLIAFITVLFFKNSGETEFKPTLGRSLITVACMVWSVLSLAGISTFLYFNF